MKIVNIYIRLEEEKDYKTVEHLTREAFKFYEDSVFESGDEELEIFEKEFPYKEKHVTDTQFKKE